MNNALQMLRSELSTGGNFVESDRYPQILGKWYSDKRIKGALNHEARGHMPSDLIRYLFVSVFGQSKNFSPKLMDWPEEILPEHKNVPKAAKGRGKNFTDRFKVQLEDKPASTIVSHISKDGHYYIHYDPTQCRSFTVREAARIQTFPDNYYFEGSRTQQFTQVGNAVPPLLAFKLAGIVANTILEAVENSKSKKIA